MNKKLIVVVGAGPGVGNHVAKNSVLITSVLS